MSAPTPTVQERLQAIAGRALARLPGDVLRRILFLSPHVVDGRTLDPHVQVLRLARRVASHPGLLDGSLAEARGRYDRETASVVPVPTPVGAVRDLVVPGPAGPIPARLYSPADAPAPLLVFLHGGGFVIGSLESHDEPCRILCARTGSHVLAVEYRLAPESPFPAAVDDACAALRWAMANAASLGADPQAVAVGGDSAGGILATVTAMILAREGTPPLAQLLVYPATDVHADTPSRRLMARGYLLEDRDIQGFFERYLPDASTHSDWRASPARAPSLAGLPPALVVTAGFDPLRDEGQAYAHAMERAGVDVVAIEARDMVHGFLHLGPVSPGAHRAIETIADAWGAVVARTRRDHPRPPGTHETRATPQP